MWTNPPWPWQPALPVSSEVGDGSRRLRVLRDNAMYLQVTGSPIHCGALGQGEAPGLAALFCLGFLLGDLQAPEGQAMPSPRSLAVGRHL